MPWFPVAPVISTHSLIPPHLSELILPGNDPNRVDQPRHIADYGQENVQPEVPAKAHLEEHSQRRNEYRESYSQAIHGSQAALSLAG